MPSSLYSSSYFVCVCARAHMHGNQKTTLQESCPSSMWVPGIQLRLSDGVFPAELSFWPIHCSFMLAIARLSGDSLLG